MTLTLDLPMPPSANKIWRFVPGMAHPLKSKLYRQWLDEAGNEMMAQRRGRFVPGDFAIDIAQSKGRRRDLDNGIKAILDLVKGVVTEDDSRCVRITTYWAEELPSGVRVKLEPA